MQTGTFFIYESYQVLSFGDLRSSFSTYQQGQSGWFYGDHSDVILNYHWSNADVANAGQTEWEGLDLSVLSFRDDHVAGYPGDLIVFQGLEGYGAWKLEEFAKCDPVPCSTLQGTWYYQANAVAAPIPEPSGALLLATALVLASLFRRVVK